MLRSLGQLSRHNVLFAFWSVRRPTPIAIHALGPLRAYRGPSRGIRPRIIPSQNLEETPGPSPQARAPPAQPGTRPAQPQPPPEGPSRPEAAGGPATPPAAAPAASLDPEDKPIPPEFIDELKRTKIELPKLALGRYRLTCPHCKGGQSQETAFDCDIGPELLWWRCYRGKCGKHGAVSLAELRKRKTYAKPNLDLRPLDAHWQRFFEGRGISAATCQRNRVGQTVFGDLVFPFIRHGEVVNAKFRKRDVKQFHQVKDAEKIFYAWDDIEGQEQIVIVEGEIDKLSLEEAGYRAVTSVPEGAPASVREGPLRSEEQDRKFAYLYNSKSALADAKRIILATDNDPPGRALAVELARRLQPENCLLVVWPSADTPTAPHSLASVPHTAARTAAIAGTALQVQPGHFKDANEVLMARGPAFLRSCIEAAIPYPIQGILSVGSLQAGLLRQHSGVRKPVQGFSIGWPNLDRLYGVKPGLVTVLAGPLGCGKSEFALEMVCRLGKSRGREGFRTAICLTENQSTEKTLVRLVEKFSGKPFLPPGAGRPRPGSAPSMSRAELETALRWADDRFLVVKPERLPAGPSTTPFAAAAGQCLNLLRIATHRKEQLRGILIDSFQGVGLSPSAGEVADFVEKLKAFAREHRVHVWVTSHTQDRGETEYLMQQCDIGMRLQNDARGLTVTVDPNVNDDEDCAQPGYASFIFNPSNGCFLPQ